MKHRITHRRGSNGTLILSQDGRVREDLSRRFAEAEASRSPSHRRNFLRRAMRFANARLAQGIDPILLFEDGTAAFRSDLARWHRNESGRYAWDWDGESVVVFRDGSIDADITQAINLVLQSKAVSGRRKYVDFLMSFANHQVHPDEGPHDFIYEEVGLARFRILDWLRREMDMDLDRQPKRSVDSAWRIRSTSKEEPTNSRALGVAGVRQLFEVLIDIMRIRNEPNPGDIDGWAAMTPFERINYSKRKYPKLKFLPRNAGAQFEIADRKWYPPIPHDPLAAQLLMSKAIEDSGRLPRSLRHIFEITASQGPRFNDDGRTMLSAWVNSDFGEWFWARNKARKDEHAKPVHIPAATVADIHRRIDDDHASHPNPPANAAEVIARTSEGRVVWPSMAQVRELAGMGRPGIEALSKIAMFPSSRGRPYAYTTWNNYYMRPIMLGDPSARIATTLGPVRPTPIWLRRSKYTYDVGLILRAGLTKEEREKRFSQLAEDMGLASTGPIYRYAHSAFPSYFAEEQVQRAKQSHERMIADIEGRAPLPDPTATTRLSRATQRRRSRAHD